MRLALTKLHIQNFKGIRDFEIDFSADRTTVSGANGTGKTSIADAFSWVLFNKDSNGNAPGTKDFREKPLDEDGNEIHNLETSVELFCTLDGQRFDLKRTQTENWVKKRNSAEATFQGNVSTYWINGVETKLADFKARISSIANEDVFRLVGVLNTFNSMDWKKRRTQLLNLVDDDVDAELLARDEYRQLADAVAQQNVSVDDMRKVVADQRKRIVDELKLLPVRIDEAKKSLPTFKPREVHDAEYIINDSKKDIENINQMIAEAKTADGGAEARAALLAAESELISIKRRAMDDLMAGKRELTAQLNAATDEGRRISAKLSDARTELDRIERKRALAAQERDDLLERHRQVKAQKAAANTTCPTCGQQLPWEKVEEILALHEAERQKELARIIEYGTAARDNLNRYEKDIAETNAIIAECDKQISENTKLRAELNDKLKAYPSEPDYEKVEGYLGTMDRIAELKASTGRSPEDRIHGLEERKRELQAIIDRNSVVIARRDAGLEAEKRIAAYEARQGELAKQLDEAEILMGQIEKFVQARCGALEASINDKFPTVRWKLFDTQINGGIADTCECMIPCSSGLVDYGSANTAAKINADVEIVNVLSHHYGVEVPLFVDNAERVNALAPTDTQLITLAVSTDSELRIA